MRRQRVGRGSESTRGVHTVLSDPHSGVDFHMSAVHRLITERTENIGAEQALLVPPGSSRRRLRAAAAEHPAAGHQRRPKSMAERALSLPEGAIIRATTTPGEHIREPLIEGETVRVVMTHDGDVYSGVHHETDAEFRAGLRLLAGRSAIEKHFGIKMRPRRAKD